MSLWEWSLLKLMKTAMKARSHGAISHMQKFSVVDYE